MLYGKLRMKKRGRQELRELSQAAPGLSRAHLESIFSMRKFDKAATFEFMKYLDGVGLNDILPAT